MGGYISIHYSPTFGNFHFFNSLQDMTVCWQWNSRVISGHFSSSRIRFLHSIPFRTNGNVNKLYFECRSIRYFAKMCKQKFVSMILEWEIIRSLFHVESILYGQTFLLVLLRVIGLQCNSIPIYLPGVRARQWAGGDRSPFQWIPIISLIVLDAPGCLSRIPPGYMYALWYVLRGHSVIHTVTRIFAWMRCEEYSSDHCQLEIRVLQLMM